ncbi:MAG: amidase family protein, partial [Patescibacteria group bacterium]
MLRLNELTIKQAHVGLTKGEFSAVELTKACLGEIKKRNQELNAVLTVCEEEALAEAKQADKRIKQARLRPAVRRGYGEASETTELTGIPYLAKDNYLTKGVRTTAASKILANYIAPYDATVIKKLRQAGAVLLGKTNLDEFAHGSSTENSAFGPTKNPHDLSRVAGGSSGGSAAAVAANFCLFALGTDTGGSIRHPAAFCGVVGFKPTYGRASRFGIIAMTSSTDVPGPIAKTVADAGIVQAAISGHDQNDFTTADAPLPDYS